MKSKKKSLRPPELLPDTSPPPIQTIDADTLLRELFAAHAGEMDGIPPDPAAGEWTIRDFMRIKGKQYSRARKMVGQLMSAHQVEYVRNYRGAKIYRFTDARP